MILGIGTDLVQLDRIARVQARFGDRFLRRSFDPVELSRTTPRHLAKRFAAKEACAKALRCGFRAGVLYRDIVVTNDIQGAPSLTLLNGAAARLADITPAGHRAIVHLSLSDEQDHAMAVVVIDAVPL